MEITPDDQRVLVEARARPNDRANLRVGLPARVRLGAYDYATVGAMDGEVTEVSADTISDEKGERFYRVRIGNRSRQDAGSGRDRPGDDGECRHRCREKDGAVLSRVPSAQIR